MRAPDERNCFAGFVDHRAVELGADAHPFVLDFAHDFAAVVLVHGRTEMGAQAIPQPPQLLRVITADVQALHLDHAGAVLQFLAHVVKEGSGIRQGKVLAVDLAPGHAVGLADGRVYLLQDDRRECLDPTRVIDHLGSLPHAGALQKTRLRHETLLAEGRELTGGSTPATYLASAV